MVCDGGCSHQDTLHYSSPAHGGWGVVRTGMLVPESHQLFICPFACGRHGAIGACCQGYKHRLSYLYLSEAEIVSGSYEQAIVDGVDQLMVQLVMRPKALLIFVSCLDDFLGTDHEAILDILRRRHETVRFAFCHMNPISLASKLPPPVNIQLKMFGLLEKQEDKAPTINFIGNLVAIDAHSECYRLLRHWGIEQCHHLSAFDSFATFQRMAQSRLNIVVAPVGLAAAKLMEEQLNISYVEVPVSYSPDENLSHYQRIAEALQQPMPDLQQDYQRSVQALTRTAKALAGIPLVIDGSAVVRPFALAETLLDYGFTVVEVMSDTVSALDRPYYERVSANYPELEVSQPQNYATVLFERLRPKCLAVGFDSAYITKARYVAGLVNDETLYGFHGIERLMAILLAAVEQEADLRQMIEDYGLVV